MSNIPHSFPFDPTYGYSQEELLNISSSETEPSGFAEFWRTLREQAGQFPLELKTEEVPSPYSAYRLMKAFYTVFPGYRVGAWIICPVDMSQARFGIVVGHGYGGREGPDWDKAAPDRIVIFPIAPGFHISASPQLPLNDSAQHVVHGIASKETYVLGSCACAFWRAVDVLEAMVPSPLEHFHYAGWSFGGGIGALMLPWEPRFASAELGQPTFGNHPLRLQMECVGSGEAVRRLHASRPEIKQTLAFFDAATAIRHLRIPVVFACAIFDPAVPPPGQFSVANGHPGPKRITVFRTGHFEYAYEELRVEEARHRCNLLELIGSPARATS